MPKKESISARLSASLPEPNSKLLNEVARETGRSKNDILREVIAQLNAEIGAKVLQEKRKAKFPPIEPFQ
ncbi:MAG: ribbon-helix-helix protein, CopG family [Patescibacteria group bacterium]